MSPPQPTPSFGEVFGREAEVSARAPGRINLIGEHVDYQDGLVLPAAIDRHVHAWAARNGTDEVRIWSQATGGPPHRFPLGRLEPVSGDRSWANYVIGVIAKYRDAGADTGGFDIAFGSTLPPGAGMSSSAALESATALVVEALAGTGLPARERALLCQSAEHDFAGVPCGIMDQLAVNCGRPGHAMLIDCRDLDIEYLPFPTEFSTIVVDSGVKHALADGEYARRKADCEAAATALAIPSLRDVGPAQIDAARDTLGGRVHRRARHVVTEMGRVRRFTQALRNNAADQIGELMAASHASLRDDYEVSCRELDELVEIALAHGAIGSRMMGGGFGGSTVNIVRREDAGAIAEGICATYNDRHDANVSAFVVSAVAGAALESAPR